MSWEHCGETIADTEACPACGIGKEQWTVQFEVTREFAVRRKAALRIELLDGRGAPLEGERYRIEPPEGDATDGELDELGRASLGRGEGRYRVVFPGRPQATVRREGEPPEGVTDPEDGDEASFECDPGRRARFQVVARLKLVLRDGKGRPLSGVRYRLAFGDDLREGTTASEGEQAGLIDEEVPAGVERAELTVWRREGGPGRTRALALGALEAVDSVKGAQARLKALGFATGKVDGDAGPVTEAALRRFQGAHGLERSGRLDDATRAKLGEVFRA
ncbi:MAG: peptidoglycan-binding protein [Planctomycetota bacterium]